MARRADGYKTLAQASDDGLAGHGGCAPISLGYGERSSAGRSNDRKPERMAGPLLDGGSFRQHLIAITFNCNDIGHLWLANG